MIIRMDLDMTVHKKGVEAVRGTVAHDMGVLTTPQLHWMVRSFNNGVPASESDYFHQLSDSFRMLVELWHANTGDSTHSEDSNTLIKSFPKFAEAEHLQAAKRLVAVNEMVNQAVGDALSGILMVEVVLRYQGWSVEQWDSMYKDLPSRQLKVKVKDRAVIITTPDETRGASPSSLQEAIDTKVGKYKGGRAFVRPSGTEDVVHVYAEASSQQSADALAQAVCVLVYHLAGGVGPEP